MASSPEQGQGKTVQRGIVWSIPNAMSPTAREGKAKQGDACSVWDFVVHPDALRLSAKYEAFKVRPAGSWHVTLFLPRDLHVQDFKGRAT